MSALAFRLVQGPDPDPHGDDCRHCGSPLDGRGRSSDVCQACTQIAAGYARTARSHLRLVEAQPVKGELSARLQWQTKRERWHELTQQTWWACSLCRHICTPSNCCDCGVPFPQERS